MADGKSIYSGLIARGFNPAQAAALSGNIQQESSFDPNSVNAASDAYGLLNWRLDRKQALADYAKTTGREANDPEAQLDFIVHEMQGSEAKNAASFLASKDVNSANDALRSYIRYGKTEAGNRLKNADAFAGQTADTGGAAPGFVNPSFNGAMPAPQLAAPAAAPPAGGQPTPSAAPPPGGTSDDDLLGAFLKPGTGASSSSSADAGQSEDDLLLKKFLPVAPPAGAKAALPTDDNHSSMPWLDPISAAANSLLESVPIVGPALMGLANNLDAATYGEKPEERAAFNARVEENQPVASTVGKVTGTVAPYVIAGGIPLAAKGLGMSGNLLTRIAMGGASGAAIQGADTLARGGSMEDAGRNALIGGGAGAVAAPIADVIGSGVNKLLSGTSPEVGKLAQLARDKYGIPIGPGQISDNPMVRVADSVVNKMPFSGGTVSSAAQQTAFNRAVASTFGETADHITPDVMAAAKSRIGNDFETVAQKVANIPYDQPLESALAKIEGDANSVLQGSEFVPLKNQLDQLVSKFAQGTNGISGETYQALTRKGAPLDRLIASDDPNISHYAGLVRDALDDALARNAPADAQKLLTQARSQYKALKTIEPLAAKAPTGDVSAPLLMGRVNSSYSNTAYGGGGALADLARIGQRFLKAPPSSGTAERLAVMELGKKLLLPVGGLGAAALNPGAIPMMLATGVPGVAGYAGLAKLAGGLLRSKTLANKLIDNSISKAAPSVGGPVNMLTRSAAALAPGQKAVINDSFQGVPSWDNGQTVTLLRPRKDGTGYWVQLPDGQIDNVGNALLQPAQ